ncbi:MAG: amidase [Streptosporangiaceae bacterium]
MVADDPADWSIVEASTELRARRATSAELTDACLQRIASRDKRYGAWIRVYEDVARAAARAADMALMAGQAGQLAGIPIGLKDVIVVAGLPLTADSAVLEGNIAPADSTAWSRLRQAGMVLLGHLHCGEFANGLWGANPWGPSISPGGSSSGSGIALAARMAPATIGSDGRGSVRMPAAFNGITAVKPTFGLISTAGCIPITFTYDVIGPMARSAADCALLLSAMTGRDDADHATLLQPPQSIYPSTPRPGPRPAARTRIGLPTFPGEPMSDGIAMIYARFQDELVALGCELISFDWPENPLELPSEGRAGDWVHILGAEARVIHEQFAGREHLYRDEFRRLIAPMSAYGSAADYVRAQVKRAEYIRTWMAIFTSNGLTAVAHPAALDEAFGTDIESFIRKPPRLMFGVWNDTNFPVVAVPAGVSPLDGSPVGMQLAGTPFTEAALLQLAIDLQATSGYHLQSPTCLDRAENYAGPQRRESGACQPSFIPMPSPIEPLTLMQLPDRPTGRYP